MPAKASRAAFGEALIELGAGFHPEISGRENVFINGIMLGLTRRQPATDDVVRRADDGKVLLAGEK